MCSPAQKRNSEHRQSILDGWITNFICFVFIVWRGMCSRYRVTREAHFVYIRILIIFFYFSFLPFSMLPKNVYGRCKRCVVFFCSFLPLMKLYRKYVYTMTETISTFYSFWMAGWLAELSDLSEAWAQRQIFALRVTESICNNEII